MCKRFGIAAKGRRFLASWPFAAGVLLLFLPAAAWGALTITGFSPAFGQPGNVVTINGSGLSSVTNVAFNKTSPTLGDFTNVSDSQLLAVVPLGATSGPLEVFAGGSGVFTTNNFLVAPVITSFSPQSGANPTMVYIMGTNFVTNGTVVIFPGASTNILATNVAQNEIAATVPAGAGDGPITVITSAGTNVSANSFMASALPTINSFAPAAGTIGASVNIVGGNFFKPVTVKFGSVAASSTVVSTTAINATVPSGAVTGTITVTTPNGSFTTTSNFFTGTGPIITDFSPTLGALNSVVTIDGLNLSSVTSATFNGVSESITGKSGTQLQVNLTANSGTGPIKVTAGTASFTTSTNFTNSAGPFVTDFNPALGPMGSTVTINGIKFTGVSSVSFGATAATAHVTSDTQISATVPSISIGGYAIKVSSSAGSYTTSSNFTVTGAAPVITSFTPTNGVRGTSVTLNGANFSGVTGVKFNGVTASFQTPTATTEMTATVPANAASGVITVANASGTGTSSSLFYMQPWITSLSTNGSIVNSSFTIAGRNLTNASALQVNGLNYNFTSSASQIVATIPSNATTGRIEITTPGGLFISTNAFDILPKIYSFSPNIGPAGTVVTISGTSLFNVTNVLFNGVSAGVFSATTNQAQAIVPVFARSGQLTVVTPYGSDLSTNSFTATQPSVVLLTKTANPIVVRPGTNITYTLEVTNEGPSITTSTVVTDTLPGGFTYVSTAASAGTWVHTNGAVIWTIGMLTNNTSVSLQIVGTSANAAALTNSAVLAFAEGNQMPSGNNASAGSYFVNDSQRTLNIALRTNPPGVLVTWPMSPVNFRMQINGNLNDAWMFPSGSVFISNSLNTYTDSIAQPQRFYRLAPP